MNDIQPFPIHTLAGAAFIDATDLHEALTTWQRYEPWIMTHLVLSGAEPDVDCCVEGTDLSTARLSLPLAAAILEYLPDDMDGALARERLTVTREQLLYGRVPA